MRQFHPIKYDLLCKRYIWCSLKKITNYHLKQKLNSVVKLTVFVKCFCEVNCNYRFDIIYPTPLIWDYLILSLFKYINLRLSFPGNYLLKFISYVKGKKKVVVKLLKKNLTKFQNHQNLITIFSMESFKI